MNPKDYTPADLRRSIADSRRADRAMLAYIVRKIQGRDLPQMPKSSKSGPAPTK